MRTQTLPPRHLRKPRQRRAYNRTVEQILKMLRVDIDPEVKIELLQRLLRLDRHDTEILRRFFQAHAMLIAERVATDAARFLKSATRGE